MARGGPEGPPDAPKRGGPDWNDGSTAKHHFVSLIRGDDGKYCYVKFTLEREKREGRDTEALSQTDEGVGVDRVPGAYRDGETTQRMPVHGINLG